MSSRCFCVPYSTYILQSVSINKVSMNHKINQRSITETPLKWNSDNFLIRSMRTISKNIASTIFLKIGSFWAPLRVGQNKPIQRKIAATIPLSCNTVEVVLWINKVEIIFWFKILSSFLVTTKKFWAPYLPKESLQGSKRQNTLF